MEKDLSKLYQQVILTHSKNPLHYKKIDDASHCIEAYNPLCGDSFTLYLVVVNDVIEEASFYGHGCALSKASTSVLMQHLQEIRIDNFKELYGAFLNQIEGKKEATDELFAPFSGIQQFPQRKTCVTLSWESLYKGIG